MESTLYNNLEKEMPQMPWRQIMGMRNRIAHGYFDINADQVFDVVKNDLIPLKEALIELRSLMAEMIHEED